MYGWRIGRGIGSTSWGMNIMLLLADEVDLTDLEKLGCWVVIRRKSEERLKSVKDNMKAGMSLIAYGEYVGDLVCLDLRYMSVVPSLVFGLGN